MPHRAWKFRIQDMLDAIAAIREYTADMNYRAFVADRKTIDAVTRNLIILGEAAVRMPDDICRRHPEVAWYEMRGMRNFVVHEYLRPATVCCGIR